MKFVEMVFRTISFKKFEYSYDAKIIERFANKTFASNNTPFDFWANSVSTTLTTSYRWREP